MRRRRCGQNARAGGAAFTGTARKQKVAAAKDEEVAAENQSKNNSGRKKGKGGQQKKSETSERVDAKVETEQAQAPARETYAAAAAGLDRGGAQKPGSSSWFANNQAQGNSGGKKDSRAQTNSQPSQDARFSLGAGASSGEKLREFVGAYYTCQSVGHRASQCPEVRCYVCNQKEHVSRHCPNRPPSRNEMERVGSQRVNCQNCGRADATFLTCPNCQNLRAKLGNGLTGGFKV